MSTEFNQVNKLKKTPRRNDLFTRWFVEQTWGYFQVESQFYLWFPSPLDNGDNPFIQWLVEDAVTCTQVQDHFVGAVNPLPLRKSK